MKNLFNFCFFQILLFGAALGCSAASQPIPALVSRMSERSELILLDKARPVADEPAGAASHHETNKINNFIVPGYLPPKAPVKGKRKFIIDTDTASDDAVALVMALNNSDIQVEAMTIVAGNVSLAQGIQNAMYTMNLCKKSVPVYAGMEKPLLRPLETADYVHGKDGMGDIGLPLRGFVPQSKHAVLELIDRINQAAAGEITLVCLGPLTNIAMAVLLDKSIAQKVNGCLIMGGVGLGRGNVTPVAEYNIWVDPEAAKIVFESGMPLKMVGWDISREYAVFDEAEAQKIRNVNTPLANFVVDICKTGAEHARKKGRKGFSLPDPIAMAVFLDSTIATETKMAFASVLTNDDDSRGQTVMDYAGETVKKPNMEVVLKADSERFRQLLRNSCVEKKKDVKR